MVHSFLNIFLPEDEYKRLRVLYFMAETTFLTVVILLLFGLMKYILNFSALDTEFVVLLGPFLMMAYGYVRYVLSGIEHTEVSNEQEYKKARRIAVKRSLLVGTVFSVINFIVKGIPTNYEDGIELIALSILFILFYFLFDFISLKRSYKKNDELGD